jgi:hypothetical protein
MGTPEDDSNNPFSEDDPFRTHNYNKSFYRFSMSVLGILVIIGIVLIALHVI